MGGRCPCSGPPGIGRRPVPRIPQVSKPKQPVEENDNTPKLKQNRYKWLATHTPVVNSDFVYYSKSKNIGGFLPEAEKRGKK